MWMTYNRTTYDVKMSIRRRKGKWGNELMTNLFCIKPSNYVIVNFWHTHICIKAPKTTDTKSIRFCVHLTKQCVEFIFHPRIFDIFPAFFFSFFLWWLRLSFSDSRLRLDGIVISLVPSVHGILSIQKMPFVLSFGFRVCSTIWNVLSHSLRLSFHIC